MRAVLFAVAVPVAPSAAFADFTGRVVNVADGDTLTVLVNKTQMRVRLDSIDAPERAQAFGKRSQQWLARFVPRRMRTSPNAARTATAAPSAWLREAVEANSEQVRRGMAWVYVKYAQLARRSPAWKARHACLSAGYGSTRSPWRRGSGAEAKRKQ
jgi:micrococcal nuclease